MGGDVYTDMVVAEAQHVIAQGRRHCPACMAANWRSGAPDIPANTVHLDASSPHLHHPPRQQHLGGAQQAPKPPAACRLLR